MFVHVRYCRHVVGQCLHHCAPQLRQEMLQCKPNCLKFEPIDMLRLPLGLPGARSRLVSQVTAPPVGRSICDDRQLRNRVRERNPGREVRSMEPPLKGLPGKRSQSHWGGLRHGRVPSLLHEVLEGTNVAPSRWNQFDPTGQVAEK